MKVLLSWEPSLPTRVKREDLEITKRSRPFLGPHERITFMGFRWGVHAAMTLRYEAICMLHRKKSRFVFLLSPQRLSARAITPSPLVERVGGRPRQGMEDGRYYLDGVMAVPIAVTLLRAVAGVTPRSASSAAAGTWRGASGRASSTQVMTPDLR